MMAIPKYVNVVGINWRVDLIAPASPEGQMLDADSQMGRCDTKHRRILILDIGDDAERLNTLLHEMTHAAHSVLSLWDQDDEKHVSRWASIWADMLIRNGIVPCSPGSADGSTP